MKTLFKDALLKVEFAGLMLISAWALLESIKTVGGFF
jgi:hypothetical protein